MKNRIFALLAVQSLVWLLATSAQEPKPVNTPTDTHDQPVVITVTSATVRDAQNLPFGRIEQILVDPSSGKIEFAFVANTVFTNVVPKVTPIPWRLLTARGERTGPYGAPGINQVLQINMERQKLMKAPSFDRRRWPDISSKDWAHTYLSYYGMEAGEPKEKAVQDAPPATAPAVKEPSAK
jgi:hypothetical protein